MKKIITILFLIVPFVLFSQKRDNVFGFATSNTFTYCSLQDTNFFNKVVDLNPRILRFPGGAVGNYYHFNGHGYGFDFEEIKKFDAGKFLKRSKGLARDAKIKGHNYDYIDDFIKLAKATNSQAILVANMFAENDDIIKMISKIKNNNIEIVGVELGSELTNRYFFQKGYTIEKYISTAKAYAKKIKDLDSTIKIGVVVAPLGKKGNHRHNVWNKRISELDFYDAIIVHSYAKVIKGTAEYGQMINEELEKGSQGEQFEIYKDRMNYFFKNIFPEEINTYTQLFDKPIWITEWNLQMSKITGNTMLQALFVVNYLLDILAKFDNIELTTYHNLGGRDYSGSIFKNYKESVEIHSTYYPLKILSILFESNEDFIISREIIQNEIKVYKVYYQNKLEKIFIINFSENSFNYFITDFNFVKSYHSSNLYDKADIFGKLSLEVVKNKVNMNNINLKPYSFNYIKVK